MMSYLFGIKLYIVKIGGSYNSFLDIVKIIRHIVAMTDATTHIKDRRGRKVKASGRRTGGYHHGDLRAALIRSAVAIVAQEGIGGLTLRKTARHAGVSHAAPAHHFKDMRGLLAAVAEEGFRQMAAKMAAAQQAVAADDPLMRFKALGKAYIEFALTHVAHFKVMFHLAVADKKAYPDLHAAGDQTFGMLVTAVEDCQSVGLLADGESRTQALFAWSCVHGLSTLAVDDQLREKALPAGPDELAEAMTDHIYFGLHRV